MIVRGRCIIVLAGRAFPLFLDGKWSKNQGLQLFWQKFAEPPTKIILRLPTTTALPHAEKSFWTVGKGMVVELVPAFFAQNIC